MSSVTINLARDDGYVASAQIYALQKKYIKIHLNAIYITKIISPFNTYKTEIATIGGQLLVLYEQLHMR